MSANLKLINAELMTFKVCEEEVFHASLALPTFLEKDMVLTLISGKWPLTDYNDCDGKHIFKFSKPDGTEISLYLQGFTWDCTVSKSEQEKLLSEGCIPSISVSAVTPE